MTVYIKNIRSQNYFLFISDLRAVFSLISWANVKCPCFIFTKLFKKIIQVQSSCLTFLDMSRICFFGSQKKNFSSDDSQSKIQPLSLKFLQNPKIFTSTLHFKSPNNSISKINLIYISRKKKSLQKSSELELLHIPHAAHSFSTMYITQHCKYRCEQDFHHPTSFFFLNSHSSWQISSYQAYHFKFQTHTHKHTCRRYKPKWNWIRLLVIVKSYVYTQRRCDDVCDVHSCTSLLSN